MLERCLSLLIGYFCGSILIADLLTRQKGKADIRQLGSGNPGAANVALQFGPGWGLLVLLGDVGKTMLACLMCRFLLFPELGGLAVLYAGLGAVLGHNWPLWTRFQGGKGVAALCTLSVLYLPAAGAVTIGLMLLVCAVSHRLSIGAAAIGPAFLLAMVSAPSGRGLPAGRGYRPCNARAQPGCPVKGKKDAFRKVIFC